MKNILLGLFILIGFQSQAKRFYVSYSTGSDANNGLTISTPWKNLSKVNSSMSLISAGDTVSFKCGDYFGGTLTITKSGTSLAPIVFNSYGTGNQPIFWGTGNTIGVLFSSNNQSNLLFYNLKVSDTTISQTDRSIQAKIQTAFQFDGTCTNNVIRKCTLDRIGVGAYFPSNSNNHIIDSCDIGNMRMVRNTPTSVNNNDDYGANPTVISSTGNKILHSYFHDCWALSYDYGYDGGAIEFFGGGTSNNLVAYNTFIDCNGTVEHGSSNGGMMENNIFAYNKIINDGKMFYINNSLSSGFKVTVKNLQFYNNVIVESYVNRLNQSTLGSMATSSDSSGIVVMKNNIFVVNSGMAVVNTSQFSGSQLVHQYNIFKLTNRSSFNLALGTGEIKDSTLALFTDATNVNPLYWDYSPTTSVGLGVAVGQTLDFSGKAVPTTPRIGILEKKSKTTVKINHTIKQKYGIYLGKVYQDGVVVYIDSTGRHGLMMAKSSDLLPNSSWSYSYKDCEAVNDFGLVNSINIQEYDENAVANNYCVNYKYGQSYDWYLPSITELKLIYEAGMLPKKDKKIIGDEFWSSTEKDSQNAMYINRRGVIKYDMKNLKKNVMPIKYF